MASPSMSQLIQMVGGPSLSGIGASTTPASFGASPTASSGASAGYSTGYGTDQTTFSPIAQGGVQSQNGAPVVTNQDKSQAISQYIQTHANLSSNQDAQLLYNSLNQLSPGELNLLFQQGTTYNFTNNDPTFKQDPSVLGYEVGTNAQGQRISPQITINENFAQQSAQQNPLLAEQDILHETTHALDSGVAAALNLPTELASSSNPTAAATLQNYKQLQAQGLATWDQTPTDPRGIYPIVSTEPVPGDLIGDAGKIFFSGNGSQIAQQDPMTYSLLTNMLAEANSIGNSLVGANTLQTQIFGL